MSKLTILALASVPVMFLLIGIFIGIVLGVAWTCEVVGGGSNV